VWTTVHAVKQTIRKDVVVAYYKAEFRNLPRVAKEKYENNRAGSQTFVSRIVSVSFRIYCRIANYDVEQWCDKMALKENVLYGELT
jgi:hypothetical protein